MAKTDLDDLNRRICEAFGVDPDKNAGFRFTVLGGELPALEVFQLPPLNGNGLSDEQAEAVESISHRFVVVPADDPRLDQVPGVGDVGVPDVVATG